MKAFEIMNDIIGEAFLEENKGNTVDTIKTGDAYKEVKKIGVCFIATPDVIKQANEWGADLLITHEPTFYNHHDILEDNFLTTKKLELLKESDMTVYRYHDSMHSNTDDLINASFLKNVGLDGEFEDKNGFVLKNEKSPIDLVCEIQKKLNIKYPRIVGCRDGNVRKIYLALGARGSKTYADFITNDYDMIISGELCEWRDCEPIRDMAQMGYQKTIIILGHAGSERDGMRELAEKIDGKYGSAMSKYFECKELYTYLDDIEK